MGDVGTETVYRFPGETSGRRARLRAEEKCPVGSHRIEDVYKVDGGFEAVAVRIYPPNSQWDYDRAVEARQAKPEIYPEADPSRFNLGARNRALGGEPDHSGDVGE